MKPCPFCGKRIDINDGDTLYPSGSGWKEEGGFRSYHRFTEVPKEQWCWSIHCNVSTGGCGVSITGDSKEETIQKWESRV